MVEHVSDPGHAPGGPASDSACPSMAPDAVVGWVPAVLHQPPWHRKVGRIASLPMILVAEVAKGGALAAPPDPNRVWVGWGAKRSGRSAERVATLRGERCWRLEDGFLRSYAAGAGQAPLSLVIDDRGIYYDATRPSALEDLLNGPHDLLDGVGRVAADARARLLEAHLSKYNDGPDPDPRLFEGRPGRKVLVVDQTRGDLSVRLGGADDGTFREMLSAACAENPDATVFVKTHPEVSAGAKRGYLTDLPQDGQVVPVRGAANPLALIERVDRVYVVTSHMGFEALLAGRSVTCFGIPWYSGWGATDDRQACARRTRARGVMELFAAAYLHYARYVDPVTHGRGTIFDVIDHLRLQKARNERLRRAAPRRFLPVGMSRRKVTNVTAFLGQGAGRVAPADTADAAARLQPEPGDTLVCWGRQAPPAVQELAAETGAGLVNMEDGFIRSVGLGSNFVRPLSLVLDGRGIYFDAGQDSDLEDLLNRTAFTEAELARARRIRRTIVEEGITKYNVERHERPAWAQGGQRIVLVPGQVEDDASIRFGCADVRTNLQLLAHARTAEPDALVVYKPHPDVVSRNRFGTVADSEVGRYADIVETGLSVISCIEACDTVHTMTSLTGFDALLRDKPVVTYGRPFYAGWGLTSDRLAVSRRHRSLTLDMLVTGALLHYPMYYDWELGSHTSCEATLQRIVERRTRLRADGRFDQLRHGRVDQRLANRWKRWLRSR